MFVVIVSERQELVLCGRRGRERTFLTTIVMLQKKFRGSEMSELLHRLMHGCGVQ